MSRSTRVLPSLRHFAVTWSLPDDFGGMTSVIFRRSAGFAAAGAPVTVLTFDDRLDTATAADRLRERGVIAPGVEIVHLWDWLAVNPLHEKPGDEPTASAPLKTATEVAGEQVVDIEFDSVVRRRERRNAEGEVLQVDRFRADGSLLASDVRDTLERGRPGGRLVVVYGVEGRPVRRFTSMWGLYRHWLDRVTDKQRSMLIVDSKTAARFVRGYRRKHVATVHVVHSSHRSGDGEPGRPLKASRRDVLTAARDFDVVVALTERQRLDLVSDLGPEARVAVVPNAIAVDRLKTAPLHRPANHGVMIASLTSRKRVGHALAAAAAAGVDLDVFGEGTERPKLQHQIDSIGADAQLHLRGHRPDAAVAFRDASFSLLTSSAEGAPLVLLESMAAGCVPIAYDIRYGPRDIIRDGVDGFVVAPGDTGAMAARIAEFVAMPERKRQRMRREAQRSTARYEQVRVTEQWAVLFADIARRRWPATAKKTVRARAGAVLRRVRR